MKSSALMILFRFCLSIQAAIGCAVLCLGAILLTVPVSAEEKPFRPVAGQFPPLEKAHDYRGELIFVDHANRRGSLRVEGSGKGFAIPLHRDLLPATGSERINPNTSNSEIA
tara:strand:- start:467 stop:802 length:336 start_codon:yes stop_codon:yes gene_type:complete